jgi:diguanylate cyclase (GGDEF)-like protein
MQLEQSFKMQLQSALRDELTGALSRSALYYHLEQEAAQARRHHASFSLLVFDLDHFKSINDAFGHSRGDQVLINLVRRVEAAIRGTDLLFRFGGDEFALLLPDTDRAHAAVLGRRLVEVVTATPVEGEPPVTVSLSGGLAAYPEDATTIEALFEKADRRNYQAKRTGRGRVVAEDGPVDPTGPHPFGIETPSRLLDRDRAMQDFNALLAELAAPGLHEQRGLALLTGLAGAGHTRFLSEARQAAHLQGYGVLAIQGNAALKNRYLGALTEALQNQPSRAHPAFWLENPAGPGASPETLEADLTATGGKSLLLALAGWLAARGNTGLLITVENWPELDLSSQEFLRRLLGNRQELAAYRVALVCGMPVPPARGPAFAAEEPPAPDKETTLPALFRDGAFLWRKIELTTLSTGGVQAWLRHSLQWEAPAAFVNWLHAQTGGLPIRIREGLDFLLKEKALYRADAPAEPLDRRHPASPHQNWLLRADFAGSGLAEYLERLAEGIPNNLPWPGSGSRLTEFIGREDYLQKIKQELTAPAYGSGAGRLVTLVGPGGIGKTRLSLQAGAELLQHFREGVYFVPLVGVLNPSEIVPAIGEALRLRLTGDGRAMQEQLFIHLQNRRALLILDNFEQLLEGAGILAELLAQAPQVRLLVTSREPLKLQIEAGLWLEGLSYPASVEDENFDAYGAVRLFVQKVRQPSGETSLPELDRFWLLKLCRLLEGIPLGLELAATWLRSFSLPQIVRELEQNSGFTAFPGDGETSAARLPQRHQRLEAVINWFWARLSRAEQRLVEGLSVFRGGFRIEAAREVVGASPFFLDSLIAKSFLSVSLTGRYEMHELLRQYAGAKLAKTSREEGRARLRYARFYAEFLQKRESDLENGRPDVLEEVSPELENIRNAWLWLVENNRLELISRCVRGLSFFYQYKGFFGEGEEALNTSLVRLRRLHARCEAGEPAVTENITDLHKVGRVAPAEIEVGLEDLPAGPQKGLNRKLVEDALARVLIEIGAFLREHSSFEQLCQYGAEAVTLARANRQRGLEGAALARMGSGLLWQGKHPAARAHLEGGLRLAREVGNPLVQADCLRQLGILSDVEEDYAASVVYSEKGLVIYRQLGNRLWESASLSNIGEAYFQQGCYEEAENYLRAAFTLSKQINFVQIQTLSSLNLGKTYTLRGNYAAGAQFLEQGLEIARRINNSRMQAECLCAYTLLAHFQGEYGRAVEYGEESLRISREQGNREYEGYALTYLGHAWAGLGRPEEARRSYQAAYDLRTGLHQYAKSLDALAGLARCAWTAGNLPLAQSYARQILDFLTDKNWRLNGIVDALWVYQTCRELLEEAARVEESGSNLAWQLKQFATVAGELRERRYGLGLVGAAE